MFEVPLQIRVFKATEFLNTSRIFAPNTQQDLLQKQLVDGANDLHAWNIEDVCTHLNNVKCQSKLQLLKICNPEIFNATNYSLHKIFKVVYLTSIIYFGYNSSTNNDGLPYLYKLSKFIEG